jgi:hypothetical protein
MAYKLSWHVPDRVLFLSLSGDYTVEDAKEVNRLITLELDRCQEPLSILMDVTEMNRPVNFVSIRAVQTYMRHRNLQHIYIAASDRLVKLAMVVIFNLGWAYLHTFDDMENATLILQRQLDSTA